MVHLTVIQIDGTTNAKLVYSYSTEVIWNKDYSSFRPSHLLWWDDISYVNYQGQNCYCPEDE